MNDAYRFRSLQQVAVGVVSDALWLHDIREWDLPNGQRNTFYIKAHIYVREGGERYARLKMLRKVGEYVERKPYLTWDEAVAAGLLSTLPPQR